jgi:C4-dicarboxylate-specific signal transduction histidine kinase
MIKKESREKRKVDLNLLTRDVYLLFNGQATLRDIFIETEFSYNKPYVLADPILIQQVILNLLHNAAEALEKNRESYKRIILKTLIWDKKVFVSVSDNGPEIPDDIMKEIFKPFFTTKESGLGIGLAICRSIISDHGGDIQVEKNKEEGVTFTFSLGLYEEKNR